MSTITKAQKHEIDKLKAQGFKYHDHMPEDDSDDMNDELVCVTMKHPDGRLIDVDSNGDTTVLE